MISPKVKSEIIEKIALNRRSITGNDFRRFLMSNEISTAKYASDFYASTDAINYATSKGLNDISDDLVEKYIVPLYNDDKGRLSLPIPILGKIGGNQYVTFSQEDLSQLIEFIDIEQKDLARFLGYGANHMSNLLNGKHQISDTSTIFSLGLIFHLLHHFKEHRESLADATVLSLRQTVIEKDRHHLLDLYNNQDIRVDWRNCLINKGLSQRRNISPQELQKIRLSNGLDAISLAKYISGVLERPYSKIPIQDMESTEGNQISFGHRKQGFWVWDIILDLYDNTHIADIPIRGKTKAGRLLTYSQKESRNLYKYFSLSSKDVKRLSGAGDYSIKLSEKESTTKCSLPISLIKTISILSSIRDSIESQKSIIKNSTIITENRLRARSLKLWEASKNSIITDVQQCGSPNDLTEMVMNWDELYATEDGFPSLQRYTLSSEQRPVDDNENAAIANIQNVVEELKLNTL